MAHIDMTIQLYGMVSSGTYNVRALGTLVAEQYFADQARRTHEGKNIPSCHKLGHIQAHMVDEMKMRMKPEQVRGFPLRMTASTPVYPSQSVDVIPTTTSVSGQSWKPPTKLDVVVIKNHAFDSADRSKVNTKKRKTLSSKFNAPLKGQIGVRQYHRTDNCPESCHIAVLDFKGTQSNLRLV
ncbi:uncharacterized protein LOC144928296 [Branchiostoma floridae x Branchiostoma belcheri]